MIASVLALLLVGMIAPAPAAAPEPSMAPPTEYAQLIVRKQIVIRSIRLRPVVPGPEISEWREGKGPKCLPARAIVGASLLGQSSVDLILRDSSRIRAQLESACPALDYYYGFYISPGPDGLVCADRDAVRSRMGGECAIDRFQTLRPSTRRRPSLDKGEPLGPSRADKASVDKR
ncbi:MAG: hypothetical protein JWN69_2390 [Alphaproteobacteria bacterium]|nr:hypothetical protein [Alphaproteobacteria bacterium]